MRLRLSALLVCLACGVTSVASGQEVAVGDSLASRSYGSSGMGVANGAFGAKVGEGSLLHASLGADIGYDSNVFYQSNPTSATVMHVTPAADISNASRDGSAPDAVYYDLAASLVYREYLSGDDEVRSQRAFNPTVAGSLRFSSRQTLSLSLSDTFARSQDPLYVASTSAIAHDRNVGSLQLKFAPGGGRIQLVLGFTNVLDVYETDPYKVGNNMTNTGVLDLSWRWLPKTALFVQVSQGAVTYLESNSGNFASYPFSATAGLRGLLTQKLAVKLAAGYGYGFYASGAANPSGFGDVILIGEINYNMSMTTAAGLGYTHEFQNSPLIGNFYNVDAVYGSLRELVGARVAVSASGRFENRAYYGTEAGIQGRTDKIVTAGLTADYMIQRVFYLGVGYTLSLASTNSASGVDYTKHVVVGRIGVLY
ncbi:MAG: outer membrane beta-barrel protein [Polyangia bacterium]